MYGRPDTAHQFIPACPVPCKLDPSNSIPSHLTEHIPPHPTPLRPNASHPIHPHPTQSTVVRPHCTPSQKEDECIELSDDVRLYIERKALWVGEGGLLGCTLDLDEDFSLIITPKVPYMPPRRSSHQRFGVGSRSANEVSAGEKSEDNTSRLVATDCAERKHFQTSCH